MQRPSSKKIHWTGAFLTFVGGLVWMSIQSWISIIICSCSNEVRINKSQDVEEFQLQSPQVLSPKDDGCRTKGLVRLSISGIGFLLLVVGIVLAVCQPCRRTLVSCFKLWVDKQNWSWLAFRELESQSGMMSLILGTVGRGRMSISAAFCEWILTFLVVIYMLTFVPEFKTIQLRSPVHAPQQRWWFPSMQKGRDVHSVLRLKRSWCSCTKGQTCLHGWMDVLFTSGCETSILKPVLRNTKEKFIYYMYCCTSSPADKISGRFWWRIKNRRRQIR